MEPVGFAEVVGHAIERELRADALESTAMKPREAKATQTGKDRFDDHAATSVERACTGLLHHLAHRFLQFVAVVPIDGSTGARCGALGSQRAIRAVRAAVADVPFAIAI